MLSDMAQGLMSASKRNSRGRIDVRNISVPNCQGPRVHSCEPGYRFGCPNERGAPGVWNSGDLLNRRAAGPVYTARLPGNPRVRRTAEVIYQELLALRCRRGERAALEELV